MAGLGCLPSKQAPKGVLLMEGTASVPLPGALHAVEMQVWEQGTSTKRVCREKKGFFPWTGAWLTRCLPTQRASC